MAKIIKFKIKNYKSIVDSETFYLDEKLTVLAGKNESGKTSILEAIEDFDTEKEIRQDAKSIINEESSPELNATIKFTKKEIKKIQEEFEIEINEDYEIEISKNFENKYSLKTDLFSSLRVENAITLSHYNDNLDSIKKKINKFITPKFDLKKTIDLEEIKTKVNEEDILADTKNNLLGELEGSERFLETEMIDIEKIEEELIQKLKDYIPYFILFDTSKDQNIPNEVSFSELDSNEFIQDLKEISDLDLELIKDSTRERERTQMELKLNIDLPKSYKKFWDQDLANIKITWRDDKLFFWVVEDNKLYHPSMRSKGKQWHIAFYIKITARAKEDKPNFLLIDEPGLFLHSKAQKDILNKIKDSSEEMQIMYSTHSPYLIDINNLDKIRLVEKENSVGTKVSKITAKPKSKDTLAPILTAIGEDQTVGIKTDKKNSIILEGFSDFLWLKSFKILLKEEGEINLIPGTGGDSCLHVGGIIFGWGLNPIFILDNDKAGRVNKAKLMKKLAIEEEKIIQIPFDKDGGIEDLFINKDRIEYADYSKDKSKVILATQFLRKIESGNLNISDLEVETIKNFKEIFKKLKETISKS